MGISFTKVRFFRAKRAFKGIRAEFYENMADSMEDGEALPVFLENNKALASRFKLSTAPLFEHWERRFKNNGGIFSEAINGTVPPSDYMLLRVAEESAKMPEMLRLLSSSIEDVKGMKSVIVGALALPAFLVVFSLFLLVFFASNLGPILLSFSPPEQWPAAGRFSYNMGLFLKARGWILVPFVAGAGYVASWSFDSWTGGVRDRLDKFPPYSIYAAYNSAIFLVTLSALQETGKTISVALQLLRSSAPPWMRRHISKMLYNMESRGQGQADAMNTGMFSREVTAMIVNYGRRSNFEEAISRLGKKALQLTTKRVKTQSAVLSVVALIVVGLFVGFTLISFVITIQEGMVNITTKF